MAKKDPKDETAKARKEREKIKKAIKDEGDSVDPKPGLSKILKAIRGENGNGDDAA